MAEPLWRVGAFADRHPSIASDYGRLYALQASAIGLLYKTAGIAGEATIRRELFCRGVSGPGEPPDTCCGLAGCGDGDSCCSMGSCAGCTDVDEEFEGAFPDVDGAIDEAHALVAAIHDILADPDVEDVRAALEQAQTLAAAGELTTYYVPKSPARELPEGGNAPAKCPICGATECQACGCPCQCCDGAADAVKGEQITE